MDGEGSLVKLFLAFAGETVMARVFAKRLKTDIVGLFIFKLINMPPVLALQRCEFYLMTPKGPHIGRPNKHAAFLALQCCEF